MTPELGPFFSEVSTFHQKVGGCGTAERLNWEIPYTLSFYGGYREYFSQGAPLSASSSEFTLYGCNTLENNALSFPLLCGHHFRPILTKLVAD